VHCRDLEIGLRHQRAVLADREADRGVREAERVPELAEPLPISLPAVSRHLKVLEQAGLIARSREAQWRPARMQADPLDDAVAWMQSRKATWKGRMDRLDAHLRRKGARR
jgi:DNA-binding transcriptional ArsR family regulator